MKFLLILLTVFILTFGCSEKKEDVSIKVQKKELPDSLALKLALIPTLDCMPFFVDQHCGIFGSNNLQVKLFTYPSQLSCEEAYKNKKVDGFYSDLIRSAFLQNEKEAIKVVMSLNSEWSLVSSKALRFKKLAQLNDRMIVISRHSATDFLSDIVVEKAKINKRMVYRPQINDVNLRAKMVNANQIDAAILPEPQAQMSIADGNSCLFTTTGDYKNISALSFSIKALSKKSEEHRIKVLIECYNQAVDKINENPSICDSVLIKLYKLSSETAKSIKIPKYDKAFLPKAAKVDNAVKWLKGRGKAHNNYSGDTLIVNKFISKKNHNKQ